MESTMQLEKRLADCVAKLDAKAKDGNGPAIVGRDRQNLKVERASIQMDLDAIAERQEQERASRRR